MRGWILAGFLNILAGLFAYMTGQTNLFGANVIRFGIRLQGFFKDPNVLGPFLVPPAAYFMKLYLENDDKKLLNTIGFFFLSFGVLITFSRAAWLNYATTVLLIFITLSKNLKRTLQVLLILTLSLVIILLFFNLTSNVDILGYNIKDLFFSRLGLQSYDQERFSSQSQFDDILSSTSILFGAGPGNYEYFSGMATHSLFARYLGERGFVGFILFVFFLCTVFYKIAKSPYKTFLIPVLIGQLVNAIFVDTRHWRHLWLLFSLAFV